jgi:hypothetical protein
MPRSCLTSSGTVAGISSSMLALPGSGHGEESAGEQVDHGPTGQEVQVVTWPLSSPLTCFNSW